MNLPEAVNKVIADKYAGKRIVVTNFPMWSTIRFLATIAVDTATIAATTVTAFAYGANQDMAPAGRAGTNSTQADTNLLVSGQTRDQADYVIYGLCAYVSQDSDPFLASRIMREASCTISTNGNSTIPLGTIDMFPAGGGLMGIGQSFLLEPPLDTTGGTDGGPGAAFGVLSNGNPMAGNFFQLPQPIMWSGVGKGSDSTLSLAVTPGRAITRLLAASRVAAAGVAAYTRPSASLQGLYVDIRWRLVGVSIAETSKNV